MTICLLIWSYISRHCMHLRYPREDDLQLNNVNPASVPNNSLVLEVPSAPAISRFQWNNNGTILFDTFQYKLSCPFHLADPPSRYAIVIEKPTFWLKYSLVRDGASLPSLLRNIRDTKRTLIAIETVEGEVFESFTSSPWRKNWNYYGNVESFLWRMRRTRSEKDAQYSALDQAKVESKLDVFYWTGSNEVVQYCNHDMIAVGGGSRLPNTCIWVHYSNPPPTWEALLLWSLQL